MSTVSDYWKSLVQQAKDKGLKKSLDDVEKAWRKTQSELEREGVKPDNAKYKSTLMLRTKEAVLKESKNRLSLAYRAIERDSLSSDKKIQDKADKDMVKLLNGKLSDKEVDYYVSREIEHKSMKESKFEKYLEEAKYSAAKLMHKASKNKDKEKTFTCTKCNKEYQANPVQLKVWGGKCYECFGDKNE